MNAQIDYEFEDSLSNNKLIIEVEHNGKGDHEIEHIFWEGMNVTDLLSDFDDFMAELEEFVDRRMEDALENFSGEE